MTLAVDAVSVNSIARPTIVKASLIACLMSAK
jgi:hypothetical protein